MANPDPTPVRLDKLEADVGNLAETIGKIMSVLSRVCGCPGLRERFEGEIPLVDEIHQRQHHHV